MISWSRLLETVVWRFHSRGTLWNYLTDVKATDIFTGGTVAIGHSRYWTATSVQPRLTQGVVSNANDVCLFLMLFPRMSLHCKLVPVQYRKYKCSLVIRLRFDTLLKRSLTNIHLVYWDWRTWIAVKRLCCVAPEQRYCNKVQKDWTSSWFLLKFPSFTNQVMIPEYANMDGWHQRYAKSSSPSLTRLASYKVDWCNFGNNSIYSQQ